MSKWLIFGKSPFVNTIKDFSFTEKYKGNRIAVNTFNNCEIDYRVANDTPTMFTIYRENLPGKRILHRKNLEALAGTKPELLKPHKTYLWGGYEWTFKEDHLCCRHSSVMAAINEAMKQGAKEIYLIGVDFTWGNRGEWRIGEMTALIAKALKYVDIYRVNPQEELPLSWLPLKELKSL